MRTKYGILFILLLLFPGLPAWAQGKMQVAEKKIVKKIPIAATDLFKIAAEKADIHIEGWENDYVDLQIIFSAKNQDKTITEKEIDYMKYSLSRQGNIIELRNSFILPANVSRIQSSVSIQYKIFIPAKSKIYVSDQYGSINLKGLSGNIEIHSEFSDIQLNVLKGTIALYSSFAGVRGNDINATLTCKSEKSRINISGLKGVNTFTTSFGTVDIEAEEGMKQLIIKSSRTTISVFSKSIQHQRYDLESRYDYIYVPKEYEKFVKTENKVSSFRLSPDVEKALVKIQTTYCPITLKF